MAACLIVQPWFTAIGHPAQSTLNTARALGALPDLHYLISDPRGGPCEALAAELSRYGPVTRFRVPNDSLRVGTLLGIAALLQHRADALKCVLFADAYLLAVAALWPLACRLLRSVRSLGVVHLQGPEHLAAKPLRRRLLCSFFDAPGRRLFLRTEELARAWRAAFPEIPPAHIDTLPTLEIADGDDAGAPKPHDGPLRFGVLGQVRPGKSLEWLVPLFAAHPEAGTLRVAGTFTNARHRSRLPMLRGYAGFDDRFLSDAEMLDAAASQDYVVCLYDDWDSRMEAATVFLAARAGRPVLVYDCGWAGRMVSQFGCGVAIPKLPRPDADFFRSLPRPGSDAYDGMVEGVRRFRDAHGGPSSRALFLAKLEGDAR